MVITISSALIAITAAISPYTEDTVKNVCSDEEVIKTLILTDYIKSPSNHILITGWTEPH